MDVADSKRLTNAAAKKIMATAVAKAQEAGMPKPGPAQQPAEFELPPNIQIAEAFARIDKTTADAQYKRAQAGTERTTAALQPIDYVQKAQEAMHNRAYDAVDLRLRKYEADQASQAKRMSTQ